MLLRLWMLVLLVCVSAFAPSRAEARAAENRTWVFLPQTVETRLETEPQVAGTHQENGLWNYEHAPGCTLAAESASIKYIGKLDDLKGIPRSQTLLDDLPNLGNARANYYQNSSVLRKAVRDGFEIRDASAYRPNWSPDPTLLRPDRTVGQSFLGAERLILDNKNLFLSPSGAYVP